MKGSGKKKALIAICSAVLAVLIAFAVILAVLLSGGERSWDDARKIAKTQFGMQEIWAISGSSASVSTLVKEDEMPKSRSFLYVLGTKDGQEKFIVVPSAKDVKPFELAWPLNAFFSEIVGKWNELAGEELPFSEQYRVKFLDTESELNMIAEHLKEPLEVPFAVAYTDAFHRYAAVQVGGELVIVD